MKREAVSVMHLATADGASFINTFLIGCGGDLERTKTVLSNYFSARQSIPELFSKRDPLLQENIDGWNYSCFIPLKGKQDGCKVFLGTALDPKNFNYTQFAKQGFMCFDLMIKNNEWGNGDRILIFSYDKVEDMTSYTIYMAKKSAECVREMYLPGRLKAIHNINLPPFMKAIHERFKPHLDLRDEKLIVFHKSLKTLHKYINPNILPLEFGGKAESLTGMKDKWYEILKQNRSFFIEEEEKRMEELKAKAI